MSVTIFLDNYQNVCFPGQTISGRVECNFNKEKNLRAVRIKFKGHAETEWTESESHYNSSTKKTETRHVRYHGEEVYMNAEYNLVQGGDNFTLSAGKHVYPFSYVMPVQLPSSYEGTSYGYVRYYIKATIDRPWKFDYEAVVPLNVVSPLDLNYIPGLREPVALSDEKTMCSCWCNDSGALTFNVSLPVTGFVPGQPINIGASVQNLTNVSAEQVKFKIVEIIEFITHYPSTRHRYIENKLTECVEGGIGAHGDKSWTSTLIIPNDAAYPNLLPCSIININYRLIAKVVIPFPHTNLEVEFPITVGSVALSGVQNALPGPPPSQTYSESLTETNPLLPNAGTAGFVPPPNFLPEGSKAPYPENSAPYAPSSAPPYPPSKESPYPPPQGAPYPPQPSAPLPGALYPPQPSTVPGWSLEPSKDTSASAPPSYEDITQEKKEKM